MFIESMILTNGRAARGKRPATIAVAMMAHLFVVTLLIVVPLLLSGSLPPIPMPKGVVQWIAPIPPPPPPPAARAPSSRPQHAPTRVATPPADERLFAPKDIPKNTPEETEIDLNEPGDPNGVIGGVTDGVIGGFPGGPNTGAGPIGTAAAPIRVGGAIRAPRLIKRVDPVYPAIAIAARVQGTVLLEATTDIAGRVVSVSVVHSIPLLDQSAINAVRQWVYTPVYLNGQPQPVIFTVQVVYTLR